MSTYLKVGVRHPDVVMLRDLLAVHGLTTPVSVLDPTLFDEGLRQLVVAFQRAKGIRVDGEVGTQTWGALGVSDAATAVRPSSPDVADVADVATGPAPMVVASAPNTSVLLFGVLGAGLLAWLFLGGRGRSFSGFRRRLRRGRHR